MIEYFTNETFTPKIIDFIIFVLCYDILKRVVSWLFEKYKPFPLLNQVSYVKSYSFRKKRKYAKDLIFLRSRKGAIGMFMLDMAFDFIILFSAVSFVIMLLTYSEFLSTNSSFILIYSLLGVHDLNFNTFTFAIWSSVVMIMITVALGSTCTTRLFKKMYILYIYYAKLK